jgi:glycosyltransferase involved in cell wall biosynthesis
MAVSDVVVSCSTDPEAFGRVTLEALSLGKPVAGYDHGGVHEQLSALLPKGKVPMSDLKEMVNLLSEWSKSPVCPKAKNPFTLESMLQKTISVYLSA